MARTAVSVNKGARNTQLAMGTIATPLLSTALDQANGNVVSPKRSHKLGLLFYNSKAGNVQLTVKAGAYPPAESQGQGDLVIAGIPTVSFIFIPGLEGARFLQKDGSVQIDSDAGATGTLWAIEMPA